MPDDDPPISTEVTETVTTDTGVDKETSAALADQFKDFWADQDSKSDGAPEAPGDGAAQETKEKAPKREPKADRTEIVKPFTETKEEPSDKDIDEWDLEEDPHNPQIKKQFSDIKALWHQDRAKAKAEAERASKLERELAEARQNSWTPEQKADYEHAASVRRKFDFVSDPEFVQKFQQPVLNTYHSVLNEAVEALPDRAAAQAWAKYIAENYAPDALDKNWWNHSVIDKIPDEMDRAAVRQSVTNLLKMQKERDQEITRRSSDRSAYDNWIKERDESRNQYTRKEVMEEIGIQEQKLKEILRKDPAEAKTKEEREAIEKHNERFEKLNGHFQEVMKDLSFNGPRAMVRAAVEATRAQYIEGEYQNMEKELKSIRAERDQFKAELDRIQGARRKISHTSGTPPASSQKKNGDGLSLGKDGLDLRRSFDSFWKDVDNT